MLVRSLGKKICLNSVNVSIPLNKRTNSKRMTIEEIYNSEDISVRSMNVCNYNGLTDLSAILKYYQENKTFDKLRNCGSKSNKELIELCLKYNAFENIDNLNFRTNETSLNSIIIELTRSQRDIVNNFIEINFSSLSNRTKNALTTFLSGDLKIRNISEKILTNSNFDANKIQNIGNKSITEINNYISLIVDFIKKVSSIENEIDLIGLRNRFFIERTFAITEIPNEVLTSRSIFKLTDFLFNQNAIFDKNQNIVFQKAIKIYNNQAELSLDEIAEETNLSRERVRQIRKTCLEELFSKLQFVKSIDDDLFQKYGIDLNQNHILIDKDLNHLINEFNNTNFSNEFISYLIYIYLSDRFDLVGNIEDVLQPKHFDSRNRHNWNNLYIVNRKISDEFDFNAFADDLENRLNERNEETYSFNLNSYLINFLKNENVLTLSFLSKIVENIINQEFEIFIDLNDSIVFKRNTVKQVSEYAINALAKIGMPSKLEEIYNLIEKDFPEVTKSKEALRGSLQRTPEIIYFGRSSTYGLKKWEIEKEGIKGGTIKDIILDYLSEKDNPIHIYELLNLVHQYREQTNAKNIITNLKLDPQNQFVIFNQSFIGLSGKTYNSNLTNLPKFLGKTITNYIRHNESKNIDEVEKHFSDLFKISEANIKYIIQLLIENEFIFIENPKTINV